MSLSLINRNIRNTYFLIYWLFFLLIKYDYLNLINIEIYINEEHEVNVFAF